MTPGSLPTTTSLSPELQREVEAFLSGEGPAAGDVAGGGAAASEGNPVPDSILALADRLFQSGAWDTLHAVAQAAVERIEDSDAEISPRWPRFLLKAAVERAAAGTASGAEALANALATAHRLLPKDAGVALRYAAELERQGDREEGLAVVGQALDALARSSDHAALDEILVKLLEAGDPDRLAVALPTLGALLRKGELERIVPFLDLAQETILHEHSRDTAWRELSRAARELPPAAGEALRAHLVRLARTRFGDAAPVLLSASGLEPRAAPPAEAIPRLEDLAVRSPGTYHEHNSWGVGRVVGLDPDAVTLDFPKRPGQRMTLAAAKSALIPLRDDDVRVLAGWQPEELERLRKEDPAGLVVRVLLALGREAPVTEIKKLLVGWGVVPQAAWTSFWAGAKKKLADDPRVDASHAFEQRYALAREGQGVRLPEFPRHETPRKAMALLKRVLGQHPEARATLVKSWGPGLLRWAESERVDPADRVAALCWAAELDPNDAALDARGLELLSHAFDRAFDMADLPGPMEQRRALDWSLRGRAWEKAARSVLSSRQADLREAAFQAIEGRHGKDAPAFWSGLWLDAANSTGSALTAMEHADPKRQPVPSLAAADPWAAVRGLVNLLETAVEGTPVTRAFALLDPGGWLAHACRAAGASEDVQTLLTRRCLMWKTTERNLEPIVGFARSVGLDTLVARVEEARRARAGARTAARAGARPGGDGDSRAGDEAVAAAFSGKNYMTRQAFEKTRRELEDLEAALRTTIPQAIQKARELGDLSENAEYHAAKLKQSQAETRVLLLAGRLREVILIDDTVPEPGVAGPGTEVEVEIENAGPARYWILGEGDGELGNEVVSYRAAIGRALLGRRAGETAIWSADGREIRATVRSVRVRRPD